MSILGRLFSSDASSVLAKAEKALTRGDAARALELATNALTRAREPRERDEAQGLVDRARAARFEGLMAKADRNEAAGHLEDAASWLEAALEVADEETANGLERRLDRIGQQRAAAARAEAVGVVPRHDPTPYPEDAETLEIDPDLLYDTLTSMIREDLAPRYQGRPMVFRRAFVDLNEGRAALAEGPLTELHREHPDDEIVLMELGRARLAQGDHLGAREAFEAVWDAFGDGPVDRSGALSIPLLWADAVAATGDLEPVVDRLAAVVSSTDATAEVAERYAEAQLATGRHEAARDGLAVAKARFPKNPVFDYLHAVAQAKVGDRPAAIAELDAMLAPCCRGGSCGTTRAYPPALRLLIGLRLEEGTIDRSLQDLMTLQLGLLEGRVITEDWLLRARYFELAGDEAAADDARAEAERLVGATQRQEAEPAGMPAGPARSIL